MAKRRPLATSDSPPESASDLIPRVARGDMAAIKAFRKIGEIAVPELIAAWSGTQPVGTHPRDFLEYITAAIGEASYGRADVLIQTIRDEKLVVDPLLWLSVCALTRSRDPQVNDVLLSLLAHKSSLIRETAAGALIGRKEKRAIEPLIALLRSGRDSMLRYVIVSGMRRVPVMQDIRAIPVLEKILTGKNVSPGTRDDATALLVTLRERGKEKNTIARLDWSGQAVTQKLLEAGAECTQLKSLILKNVKQLDAEKLATISQWTTLEELVLEFDWCQALDPAPLANLTAMKRLQIRNCTFEDQSPRFLARLTHLEDLGLIGTAFPRLASFKKSRQPGLGLPESALQDVGKLVRLRLLRWDLIDDENWLRWLTELKCLESLRFSGGPITHIGAGYIAKLKRLQVLEIRDSNINDTALAFTAPLKDLRCLRLQDANLTANGLATLAQFPTLTHLDLDGNMVGDDGVKVLASCSNLEGLSLRRADLTNECVQFLKRLRNLRQLIVYDQIKGAPRKELQQALPNLKINAGYSLEYQ